MTEPSDNPSPIDYRNPMHGQPRTPPSVLKVVGWTIGVLFVMAFLIAILLPSPGGRARETANRMKCASNLKQIGMAILLYANDNRGQLPPDFAAILATQDITADVFICPSCDVVRAPGPTTQQAIAKMLSGDHLSYAYVGGENIASQTSDIIVAFDLERHVPKDAAKGTGINVLMGDCSTVFVNEKVAKAIWARFNAGVRPIRLSDCDPTIQPATKPVGVDK